MGFSYTTQMTLIEWLTITGVAQTVLILVYVGLRVRNWRQAIVTMTYFFFLALAFVLQFALRIPDFEPEIRLGLWVSWAMGPMLCYLLVLQVAGILHTLPLRQHWWTVSLIPVVFGLSLLAEWAFDTCSGNWLCPRFFDWLHWLGAMAGAVAMLALCLQKGLFTTLWNVKGGREKYWLVLTLVVMNVLGVVVNLLRSVNNLGEDNADALLVILGLSFVYLVSTTLFRIYPSPVQLHAAPRLRAPTLTAEEQLIADQVRKLMEVDKVYQEPTFSRADLARELKTSEGTLSRVINIAFGKSFPRLLSEFRVAEAKIMLQDPSLAIQTIAFEAGFNSIPSFNRVFREIARETPSAYRQRFGIAGTVDSPGV